ncbi:stalk domain-containing protein [Acetivibrio cellulolyticus]|uniref:stalk domain-containing protein n=1 Tax=Acetivibrio cellulolyticus TaxID=35830 RepID=UPI0001E2BE08|nr:stalk domain-containing protein [Acetivibrio cellulolyticus]
MIRKLKLLTVATLIFTGGMLTQTFAVPVVQDIVAKLKPDVTIMINGQKLQAKDGNGKEVYPIIYNGSTYLPVRAVADAVKLPVDWDGKTQTVFLGSKNQGPTRLIDLQSTNKSGAFPIKSTMDKSILSIETGDVIKENVTYGFGLYADDITDSYNKVTFNLDNTFTKMTFKVKCINANSNTVELDMRNENGIELFGKKYKTGDYDTCEIDVTGVKTLEIQFKTEFTDISDGHKFLVIEPTLQ